MTRRATYAAANGLFADLILYHGAKRYTVALHIDDEDGTPVRLAYRVNLSLTEARQTATRYHRVLVERWVMELLWHSRTPQAETRAA